MPGPVSDSYDPEWGTSATADEIRDSLTDLYDTVSLILNHRTPMYILELLNTDLSTPINATLSEREWRIIRFALERARESI
jgi:hypothetical protein